MAPKMVPMYHPRCALTCSTLFHQFGATRPTYGTKMIILGFFWGSPKAPLTTETAPMHHPGCTLNCQQKKKSGVKKMSLGGETPVPDSQSNPIQSRGGAGVLSEASWIKPSLINFHFDYLIIPLIKTTQNHHFNQHNT